MPSRYKNKAKFINNNDLYENLFYDRKLLTIKSFIEGKCIQEGCNNNFKKIIF